MSEMHDQAMQAIFRQVLERLLDHLNQAQRASLQLLIQRLLVAAGGVERIGEFRLLVLHGNDRSSDHLLACLRAAQLTLAQRFSQTFALRVVVPCHPGMHALERAHHLHCFNVLYLHDDSRVELLLAEADGLRPYEAHVFALEQPRTAAREAWLLSGHAQQGTARGLLGSRLWLQLAQACVPAVRARNGASALVTAMPHPQRLRLLAWSRRCLRLIEPGRTPAFQCARAMIEALARLQTRMAQLPASPCDLVSRSPLHGCNLQLLSLDELLQHIGHQDRLQGLLGHRSEHHADASGLHAFTDLPLLGRLSELQARYSDPESRQSAGLPVQAPSWRANPASGASADSENDYSLGEEQLACLLFAPFVERGARLEAFVRRCHPNMQVAMPYLHHALQGGVCPDAVVRWLVNVSGVSLPRLQRLYGLRVDARTLCLQRHLAKRDARLRLVQPAAR
ncbi:hypothetical protein [Pseudomonas phoenicis]|uniref:hypothetical protein n=1 Tax=unclassified Pseudomonas TaxID=196821 RepID=UPI0039A07B85